jgi:hypothetical protein
MEFYDFPYIGNVIIPTDFHSFIFQGVGQPPTSHDLNELPVFAASMGHSLQRYISIAVNLIIRSCLPLTTFMSQQGWLDRNWVEIGQLHRLHSFFLKQRLHIPKFMGK